MGNRILKMELPDKRKRGRPMRRCMEVVSVDRRAVGVIVSLGVMEEDAEERKRKQTPDRNSRKKLKIKSNTDRLRLIHKNETVVSAFGNH